MAQTDDSLQYLETSGFGRQAESLCASGLVEVDPRAVIAAFAYPDGARVLVASEDKTARIWDAPIATASTKELMAEVCLRLHGLTRLTRDEMRLVGYAEDATEIDVCAGAAVQKFAMLVG